MSIFLGPLGDCFIFFPITPACVRFAGRPKQDAPPSLRKGNSGADVIIAIFFQPRIVTV